MIVKILSTGKSFKGLGAYLTRDAGAATTARVAWAHTLNCAFDHVPSAIDEMLWTSRNAELLKMQVGIRAGGRATENPVKHLSLNWPPEESPSRDHMIEATEDFLRRMGWDEHQAVLVAHSDKAHAHVHVVLNTVHPETGLKLDAGFERRRAQKWALDYERAQGRIYCKSRLADTACRESSPTRPMWTAFNNAQHEFDADEKSRRENPSASGDEKSEKPGSGEWQRLKDFQRKQRGAFFAEGKAAFSEARNSVFREVRAEFRPRWADYFRMLKTGGNLPELVRTKADLVAEQKEALETRRNDACASLRETRDDAYCQLLDEQREVRAGLRWRLAAGVDCSEFLESVEQGKFNENREVHVALRAAGDAIFHRQEWSRVPVVGGGARATRALSSDSNRFVARHDRGTMIQPWRLAARVQLVPLLPSRHSSETDGSQNTARLYVSAKRDATRPTAAHANPEMGSLELGSFEAAAEHIDALFRHKLSGLRRRVSRHELPDAVRALREERQASMRALREWFAQRRYAEKRRIASRERHINLSDPPLQ